MTTETTDELVRENAELRRRLEEAEEAIRALRAGEADALLVENGREQVYTLETPENSYRLLVAQVPHAAVALTADGSVIACNRRFADLLGRPAASFNGRPLREFVAPDSHAALESLFRDGRTICVQDSVTLLRPDGAPTTIWLGVHALREGALGLCLMATDLTEQRYYEELSRAQDALRASEERYRTLFESIDEGFCVIQMLFDETGRPVDYRFLETNPSFDSQTGLGQVVGKTMRQLAPAHEEHWFLTYGQVAQTGEPIRFQNRAAALHRWYDVYAFRVGDPRERKVAVLFNDITDRRRTQDALQLSEARLRAILDNMPAVVYLVDAQQRFTFINRRWETVFGLTNEQAVGRPVSDFFPSNIAEQFAANNRRVLEARLPVEVEEIVPHADGNHTYISSKVPLFDSAGTAYAVCGISIDITERKRTAEALRDADRKKDEFLATLAHELRNPLAPMRSAVRILQEKGPPDPELVWARGVIDRQLQHMARLLDDLLDVSRISRNKLELRLERIELRAVVDSAIETSRPHVEAAGHRLAVTLPPEPVLLEADPVRLAQVFANLLNNAAKYTEQGGRIELTAERDLGDVVVSVKDSGIGIAPEMLPRVFDIFSQAQPALERSQGGLGIGLSLVKGLVELHGGSIQAKSDGPGRGSEFLVRLPARAGTADFKPAPPASADRPPVVKRCILIADDNQDSADSLAQLLKILGHEVATAYDGEQAVETAATLRPQVVLLDIGMPKLNGYDACRRIREQPWGREMVLIALTGWGQEKDRQLSREAGFDGHVVKPVTPEVLRELLSRQIVEKN